MTVSTPATAPVLDLKNLVRRYGSLTAVDDVSLRLPAGARHAVIGPNGAGKTTLLNLIAGTDRPDHGTIALSGTDITRTATAKRSRLGIARSFQQPSVIGELTVLDNIVLAGWRHHPLRGEPGGGRPATGSTPSPPSGIWRPSASPTPRTGPPPTCPTASAACSTSRRRSPATRG